MKSYFSVCSSKLFWLKETLKHPLLNSAWTVCLPLENVSRTELERLQEDKLKRILRHAAKTVPFYRDYFISKGIDADNVSLLDFPTVAKKDIRGQEEKFISTAKGLPKVHWDRTSGSTGEPFKFGRSEFDYTYATLWRGLLRFGIRPGDKRVLVKGVDITSRISLKTRIRRWIYGKVNRCIVVDAHFLARSEENVIRELKRIIDYRPQYLHGYASSIYLLATTAEKIGADMAQMKVKAIVTESEKCHDFQRKTIVRVFNAPVVENYGSVEFGMIAQPASDGRLCINEDHVHVETTTKGEAVLTNLDEFGFPLIRFKNGDKITKGRVHEVLPYCTLTSIEGRMAETIFLPNGGSLQGYIVMYPISKHMKYLREYQIYQSRIDHLLIRVVEAVPLPVEVEEQIIKEMHGIVGESLNVELQKVASIPLTKRGKRMFVYSDVKPSQRIFV